jgi:hypothetical protein
MSKPRKSLSGRPVTDERGNCTWEWKIDTARIRALADGVSLDEPPVVGSADPYNLTSETTHAAQPQTAKRRSLDDMRRLSEEIKRKQRKDEP